MSLLSPTRPFSIALVAVIQSGSTLIILGRAYLVFQGLIALITGAVPHLAWLLISGLVFILLGVPLLAVKNTLQGVLPPSSESAWHSTRWQLVRFGYAVRFALQIVVLSLVLAFYADYQEAVSVFKDLTNSDFQRHVHLMFGFGLVAGWILSRWKVKWDQPASGPLPPLLSRSSE